jgi:hypothetical protein
MNAEAQYSRPDLAGLIVGESIRYRARCRECNWTERFDSSGRADAAASGHNAAVHGGFVGKTATK